MRLGEARLRQIVREEIARLSEATPALNRARASIEAGHNALTIHEDGRATWWVLWSEGRDGEVVVETWVKFVGDEAVEERGPIDLIGFIAREHESLSDGVGLSPLARTMVRNADRLGSGLGPIDVVNAARSQR